MIDKKGYTLIEVTISLFVVAIAAASILLILGKLVHLTGKSGTSIQVNRAVAIAHRELDRCKYDIDFPSSNGFSETEPFKCDSAVVVSYPAGPGPLSGIDNYFYEVKITAYDAFDPNNPVTSEEYGNNTDKLLYADLSRNILKITVLVHHGVGPTAGANDPILVSASTYKVRNGYY